MAWCRKACHTHILHVHGQGEIEEELNKSLRSFGVDPASGRLSDVAYAAAAAQLESRRSKALAARPLSHRERAAHLQSTILWHIHRVRPSVHTKQIMSPMRLSILSAPQAGTINWTDQVLWSCGRAHSN